MEAGGKLRRGGKATLSPLIATRFCARVQARLCSYAEQRWMRLEVSTRGWVLEPRLRFNPRKTATLLYAAWIGVAKDGSPSSSMSTIRTKEQGMRPIPAL